MTYTKMVANIKAYVDPRNFYELRQVRKTARETRTHMSACLKWSEEDWDHVRVSDQREENFPTEEMAHQLEVPGLRHRRGERAHFGVAQERAAGRRAGPVRRERGQTHARDLRPPAARAQANSQYTGPDFDISG